jgi:hypothetical protein
MNSAISVAHREVVFQKVCGQGCTHRNDLDLPASYAFTCQKMQGAAMKERLFYIPRELTEDGYTIAQLEEIEQTLAYYGFELLPLDHMVH